MCGLVDSSHHPEGTYRLHLQVHQNVLSSISPGYIGLLMMTPWCNNLCGFWDRSLVSIGRDFADFCNIKFKVIIPHTLSCPTWPFLLSFADQHFVIPHSTLKTSWWRAQNPLGSKGKIKSCEKTATERIASTALVRPSGIRTYVPFAWSPHSVLYNGTGVGALFWRQTKGKISSELQHRIFGIKTKYSELVQASRNHRTDAWHSIYTPHQRKNNSC